MKVYIFNSKNSIDYRTFKYLWNNDLFPRWYSLSKNSKEILDSMIKNKDKDCTDCKNHYTDFPYCTKRLGCSGYSEFERVE